MPAQVANERVQDSNDLSLYHPEVVCVRVSNTEARKLFEEKLQHLTESQRQDVACVVDSYSVDAPATF